MAAIMGEFISHGENGGNVGNAQPATSSRVLPQQGDAQCQRGIPQPSLGLPGPAFLAEFGGAPKGFCRAVFLPGAAQSCRAEECRQKAISVSPEGCDT